MLNWEKEPDNDLLINLILKNPLGRNIELYSFLNLLSNIPSGVSIALDGPWGSGKTFFVKQLEILINNNNSKIPLEAKNQPIVDFIKNEPLKEQLIKDCIAIRYDAWENDSDIDPIFSLVYNIAKEVNMNFTYSGEHDLVRKYILTGATLLQNINQINANDFIDSLLDLHKGNPTNIIASQKEIKQKVDEYFQDVCVHGEKRIIVFIDELDRCSPVFAVRLLERIKHYLSNPKVTFVFSINIDQLQHTIKKYYGEGFDANKYLHRFFYLTVKLPLIDTDKYFQYVGFNKIDTFSIICKKVVEYFNFSLRDLQRFLATSNSNGANLREAYPRSLFANDKAKQFCAYVIVPLLEGIRIDNSTNYNEVINGQNQKIFISCFIKCVEGYALEELLSEKESFGIETGKVNVDLENRIGELYNMLFVEQKGGYIGKLQFFQYDNIMKWIEMLSPNSNFE